MRQPSPRGRLGEHFLRYAEGPVDDDLKERDFADGLWIEDMGSKNGTYVNDVRIPKTRLQAEDALRSNPAIC